MKKSTSKARSFYFQYYVYGALIILTSLYAYARLGFDRSGPVPEEAVEQTKDQR